jgi:hypothetical protein
VLLCSTAHFARSNEDRARPETAHLAPEAEKKAVRLASQKKPREGAGPKSREETSVKGAQGTYVKRLFQWLQIYHTQTENLTW